MYGLYICQPYAGQIIDEEKKYEYRNWKSKMLNKPFYVLTENSQCLGIIQFLHFQELPKEKQKNWYKYAYRVQVLEKFKEPRKYIHPLGAVRWVKEVQFE